MRQTEPVPGQQDYERKVNNISVDVLVCLCLALQLTVPGIKDLLARAQRAFPPALPQHDAYQKLIAIYALKDLSGEENSNMLVYADQYLQKRNLSPLPNVNGI